MGNVMMNDNCQEYDFSLERLLLGCNKLFHFPSNYYTHVHKVPFNQFLK